MLEAEELARAAADCFETGMLTGKHLLITAGPTQENIDPVRYITNHSSGKWVSPSPRPLPKPARGSPW